MQKKHTFKTRLEIESLALITLKSSHSRTSDVLFRSMENGIGVTIESVKYLVHRVVAFAFAMAIPRCQCRHRCVVTLGEILVVLYRKPLWRNEK